MTPLERAAAIVQRLDPQESDVNEDFVLKHITEAVADEVEKRRAVEAKYEQLLAILTGEEFRRVEIPHPGPEFADLMEDNPK